MLTAHRFTLPSSKLATWVQLGNVAVVRALQEGFVRSTTTPVIPPIMTRSLWQDTASIPSRPPLSEHLVTDVCVVGAGIAGLSVAYQLARAGKRVVVLELDQVASGETGRTTAHLSSAIDDRYLVLEKAVGVDNARLAAESHTAAIDVIERVVREERID